MTKAEREIPLHEQAWDKDDVESARQLAKRGDFYDDNTTILNLIRYIDALDAQLAQRDDRIRELRAGVNALPDVWGDKRAFATVLLAADANEGEGK